MQIKTVQDIEIGDTIAQILNQPGCKATVVFVFNPIEDDGTNFYRYKIGVCTDNKRNYVMYSKLIKGKVVYINNIINQEKSEFILIEVND